MATTRGGAIAQRQAQTAQGNPAARNLKAMIVSMKGQIAKALPTVLTEERFSRMVLTAVSTTPQLAECTPASFMGAMMQAAQLGLEPNTPLGQAYLIPYRNHGQLECQFQIGYRGLIALFYRSGGKDIQASEVCENDDFDYELGLEPRLSHKPALTDRGQAIGYYAVWHTKDGGYGTAFMGIEDVRAHMQKFSKAAGKGFSPWATNFDEMAKKTVIKKALKYAPMMAEFARAVAADETIKSYREETRDILDAPDESILVDARPVGEEAGEAAQGDAPPPNVDPETGEILSENTGKEGLNL